MKTVCITFLLLVNTAVSAQYGIGLDLGASKLYSTDPSSGIKYNFLPSGNIGVYYRFKPENNKNNFLVELMISQIEGKLNSEMNVTDQNFNVIGKYTGVTYYHITSISIPLYYGITFTKVGWLLGAEFALPIYSGYNLRTNMTYYDINETTKESGSPLYIDPINFYGRIGFEYIVSNKLSLRIIYSHGINTITKKNGSPWKTLQASFGLRYSLKKEL